MYKTYPRHFTFSNGQDLYETSLSYNFLLFSLGKKKKNLKNKPTLNLIETSQNLRILNCMTLNHLRRIYRNIDFIFQ
jgi:hypothetical protein